MPPHPGVWELRESDQAYYFYPSASLARPWHAMCRIPWGREQFVVPLYVCPTPRLRPFVPEAEPGQHN